MQDDNYVSFGYGTVKRITDAACLFVIDGEDRWFPKSVLVDAEDADYGDEVEVIVAEWWAIENGLV